MRLVIWSANAVANFNSIYGYVSAFNETAAARLAGRLQMAANSLSEYPERGRETSRGLRELAIVHPYLIRYRIRDDAVVILRIRHSARAED